MYVFHIVLILGRGRVGYKMRTTDSPGREKQPCGQLLQKGNVVDYI